MTRQKVKNEQEICITNPKSQSVAKSYIPVQSEEHIEEIFDTSTVNVIHKDLPKYILFSMCLDALILVLTIILLVNVDDRLLLLCNLIISIVILVCKMTYYIGALDYRHRVSFGWNRTMEYVPLIFSGIQSVVFVILIASVIIKFLEIDITTIVTRVPIMVLVLIGFILILLFIWCITSISLTIQHRSNSVVSYDISPLISKLERSHNDD